MSVLDVNTLNCVYAVLFFFGFGYAIFIAITGGLSDIDMPDVDIDIPQIDLPGDVDIPGADIHIGHADFPAGIDAPDVSVSPLSPITLASFVTSFGAFGILSMQLFGVQARWSLAWATGGALLVSGIMFLFYSRVLIGSQGSSEVRSSELLGLDAEVTVPIGEAATGQVTYVAKSGRMTSMARSLDGNPISRGQLVKIVRVQGPQVLVKPIRPEGQEEEE
jgi:membrane protein implicated in regulation of membrane protease activity